MFERAVELRWDVIGDIESAPLELILLRDLWFHHWWSLDQFLEAVRALSDEEFKRDLGISYRSVHGALAHLVGSELVWLARVQEGRSMTLVPSVNELPDLQSIEDTWIRCQNGWYQTLRDDDPRRVIHYQNTKGQDFTDPLWRIMIHLLDHSAAYRGILIAGLRLLGRTPPASGVMTYMRLSK